MTYIERVHKTQHEKLNFLPEDYVPYQKIESSIRFGVICIRDGELAVKYQYEIPAYGGYISEKENIFGNATYCPNATRNHRLHLKTYGSTPHLVFFESEEAATMAGFRKCKTCSK